MINEFTVDEIKDAARAARVYCPGFDEARFEGLMELEKRIADSGYLEAVQGLMRLESEKGINCTQALDAYEDLVRQNMELGRKVPALEQRAEALTAEIAQAANKYEQVQNDIAKAGSDLARIKKESRAAEKKLETHRRKSEKEKQRLQNEIENCRLQANVDKEEVIAASSLKTEAENHGFTLELALNLSKERVSTDITNLESRKKRLVEENSSLSNTISKLETDIREQKELRRFHRRYAGIHGLMDKLATWNQVYFVRCNNPISAVAGVLDKSQANARFWTDKPPSFCPYCGYQQLLYDAAIYRQLNWPAGTPLKLNLGE